MVIIIETHSNSYVEIYESYMSVLVALAAYETLPSAVHSRISLNLLFQVPMQHPLGQRMPAYMYLFGQIILGTLETLSLGWLTIGNLFRTREKHLLMDLLEPIKH